MTRGKNRLVFLAGPIHEQPVLNLPAFRDAQQALIAQGYRVIVPYDLFEDHVPDWKEYARKCVHALIDCDLIATLPDFDQSKSSNLFLLISQELTIPVKQVEQLIPHEDHKS